MTRRLPLSLLVAMATVLVSAKAPDVPSAWRGSEIVIDGNDAEWPGAATLLDGTPVAVGVANDGDSLFVRIRTTDRVAAMQILYGGLTVWVDPGGREKKALGLRYPVGATLPEPTRQRRTADATGEPPPEGDMPRSRRPRTPGEPGPGARPQGPPPDPVKIVPPRVEVLGPGKDEARSLVLEHLPPGVAVGIARVEDSLVYEFRLPLSRSAERPFAVGAAPGARIGIGLETGKVRRPPAPDRPGGATGGGRMPGGGGPGGMGPGGMGGRGGPGGGGQRRGDSADVEALSKPLKRWVRVQLASAR